MNISVCEMLEVTPPPHAINGKVSLPSSKSISNRHLILNHLVGGKATLRNISDSEDTRLLEKALRQIKEKSSDVIDVGHAGTDFRFLTAMLSFSEGTFQLTGSSRLQERPIRELVNALKQLGAEISYLGKEGYPPLKIHGKRLNGGIVTLDASSSSQFASALMLSSPLLNGELSIKFVKPVASKPYIKMTASILEEYGINVQITKDGFHLGGTIKSTLCPITIEGDWSAASYYYSICALSPGSKIVLNGLSRNSLQGDSVLERLYKPLGVKTSFLNEGVMIEHSASDNNSFQYDFSDCPDLAQTVAVTCAAQERQAQLTGLSTLRIKETDRIEALATELRKIGCEVEQQPSALKITGGRRSPETIPAIKTYNDHRMAMSFAPLSISIGGIKLEDPEVVVKSYPGFWSDLRSLGFSVNLQPR